MQEDVKNAAQKLISKLMSEGTNEPIERRNKQAQIAIAQVALFATTAMIGTCGSDGTELHFEGRDNGLYVCCAGNPAHCWKIG